MCGGGRGHEGGVLTGRGGWGGGKAEVHEDGVGRGREGGWVESGGRSRLCLQALGLLRVALLLCLVHVS